MPPADYTVPLSHAGHVAHAGHGFALVVLAALSGLALALYVLAAVRERRRGRAWSGWRVASFAAGCLTILAALLPPLATLAHADLRVHMVQHLLLGMLGPVGVVLGAPVTLALRALPTAAGRVFVRLLHSRYVRIVSHPLSAAVLNVGGMALLYFTPLYAAMADSPALHAFVHVHFVAAGCLYA